MCADFIRILSIASQIRILPGPEKYKKNYIMNYVLNCILLFLCNRVFHGVVLASYLHKTCNTNL
jgi:hypothetical protein